MGWNGSVPPKEMHPLRVEQELRSSMKEFSSSARDVCSFCVLAQLNKVHFLLPHVIPETEEVEIGWHDDARLLHELPSEIRQDLHM